MPRTDAQVTIGVRGNDVERQLVGQIKGAANRGSAILSKTMGKSVGAGALNTKGFKLPLGRITGDISNFQSSLEASTARVLAFGASASVLAGVAKGFKEIVRSTIEVEKALQDINVIFNLSSSNLQKFSNGLFDVARKTGQSFGTIAVAATEFARQGLGAEETLIRVRDALILTRLTSLGAVQSVEALTAAVNGFRDEALSTTEIVNRLANVDAAFAVSSADLANSISRSGAVAQDAKVSFNELLAATTAIQQSTARGGAVIGNALKTIFVRLQRSSVRKVLEGIGIATQDASGNFRSATDVIRDYAAIYGTLTDAQKAYTGEQIAGVRQINILSALVKDLTSEFSIYDRALTTANSSTDEAIVRNDKLNETIDALIQRTKASGQELGKTFGNLALGGGLKNLVGTVDTLFQAFEKLFNEQEGSTLAKGLLKGFGDFLAGPGLILLGKTGFKLVRFLLYDLKEAAKTIAQIGAGNKDALNIQRAITEALQNDVSALQDIKNASGDRAKQEEIILATLKNQRIELEGISSVMAAAKSVALSGKVAMTGGVPIVRDKRGFIPNMAISDTMRLEQEMSGRKPIFDTKPFPHVRNSSQPTFASAVRQHGGLKNAVRDSMAAQGVRRGFIPNFATPAKSAIELAMGGGAKFGRFKVEQEIQPIKPKVVEDTKTAFSAIEIALKKTSESAKKAALDIRLASIDKRASQLFASPEKQKELRKEDYFAQKRAFEKSVEEALSIQNMQMAQSVEQSKRSQFFSSKKEASPAEEAYRKRKNIEGLKKRSAQFVSQNVSAVERAAKTEEQRKEREFFSSKKDMSVAEIESRTRRQEERLSQRKTFIAQAVQKEMSGPRTKSSRIASRRAFAAKSPEIDSILQEKENRQKEIAAQKDYRTRLAEEKAQDKAAIIAEKQEMIRQKAAMKLMTPNQKRIARQQMAQQAAEKRSSRGGRSGLSFGAVIGLQMVSGAVEQYAQKSGSAGTQAAAGGLSKGLSAAISTSFLGLGKTGSIAVGAIAGITTGLLKMADKSATAQKNISEHSSSVEANSSAAANATSVAEQLNAAYAEGDPRKISALSKKFREVTSSIEDPALKAAFTAFSGDMDGLAEATARFTDEAKKRAAELDSAFGESKVFGASGAASELQRRIQDPIGAIFDLFTGEFSKERAKQESAIAKQFTKGGAEEFSQSFGPERLIALEKDLNSLVSGDRLKGGTGPAGLQDFDVDRLVSFGLPKDVAEKAKRALAEGNETLANSIIDSFSSQVKELEKTKAITQRTNVIRKLNAEIQKKVKEKNDQIESVLRDFTKTFERLDIARQSRQKTFDPFFQNQLSFAQNAGRISQVSGIDLGRTFKQEDIIEESLSRAVNLASGLFEKAKTSGLALTDKDTDRGSEIAYILSLAQQQSAKAGIIEQNTIKMLSRAAGGTEGASEMVQEIEKVREAQEKNLVEAKTAVAELRVQTSLQKIEARQKSFLDFGQSLIFDSRNAFQEVAANLSRAFSEVTATNLNAAKSFFERISSPDNAIVDALRGFSEFKTREQSVDQLLGLAGIKRATSKTVDFSELSGSRTTALVARRDVALSPEEASREQFSRADATLRKFETRINQARERLLLGSATGEDVKVATMAGAVSKAREIARMQNFEIVSNRETLERAKRPDVSYDESVRTQAKIDSVRRAYFAVGEDRESRMDLDNRLSEIARKRGVDFSSMSGGERKEFVGSLTKGDIEKFIDLSGENGPVVKAIRESGDAIVKELQQSGEIAKPLDMASIGDELAREIAKPSSVILDLTNQIVQIEKGSMATIVNLAANFKRIVEGIEWPTTNGPDQPPKPPTAGRGSVRSGRMQPIVSLGGGGF
jgi:TP901 family phage tail tape measure protein